MTTEVEFTDRYGGRAPSWLRGCHADCEAMGYVPIFIASGVETKEAFDDGLSHESEPNPAYIKAWQVAHAQPHETLCDGWHFVKCPDCDGTGRVPWFVSVARVPRWLWKGVRFYGWAMNPDVSPPDWTWWMRFKNATNAAFLADLRRLRR